MYFVDTNSLDVNECNRLIKNIYGPEWVTFINSEINVVMVYKSIGLEEPAGIYNRTIEGFLEPHHFYSNEKINYNRISLVSEEFLKKLIELWTANYSHMMWVNVNVGFLDDLRKNYQTYFKEAKIKAIIE